MNLLVAAPAMADSYVEANFSGALGSNANVKPPFNGNGFAGGQSFSGSFVYDASLVPSTPGVTNVFFSSFPDIGDISPQDAFNLNFGPYSFTLADNLDALTAPAIQYNNGQFAGFVFVSDFLFQDRWYQFRAGGQTITVRLLDGVANSYDPHGYPTGNSYINAKFDIGDANLSGETSYVPGAPVPEPAAWLTVAAGLGLAGAAARRRGARIAVTYA